MSRMMEMVSTVVEAPAQAPVDLMQARSYLRALGDHEDVLIDGWIQAAAAYFTEYTSRPIIHTTYEVWLDAFPRERVIELPHPPLVAVLSVRYVGSDGTVQDFTAGSPLQPLWQVRAPVGIYARRGRLEPVAGHGWPVARTEAGAVRIRFRAGYGETPAQVPDIIRQALLLMAGSSDRFRTSMYISEGARLEALPFGVDQLLTAFRHTALAAQVLHRP